MTRAIHLCAGDAVWGAFRAAHRIHTAVDAFPSVDSSMWVLEKNSGDPKVETPLTDEEVKRRSKMAKVAGRISNRLRRDRFVIHSPALAPSNWAQRFQIAAPDIVHLHWICLEMASIADIGRIRQPVIWTLHDMWAFSGAAHTSEDEAWKTGYAGEVSLNRFVWRRKKRHWRRPFHIVAISNWMADCIRQSALMQDWPVTVIGNPIDTKLWAPRDKAAARDQLGIEQGRPHVLFGASVATSDPRKGFALLKTALERADFGENRPKLLVFGNEEGHEPEIQGYDAQFFGAIDDDETLACLYAAADVMAVPSRLEPFGQTASEALACGTPVLAFGNTGLADVVSHGETGYLARAFDTADLANGLAELLARCAPGAEEEAKISEACRQRVVEHFSYDVIGRKYADLYAEVASPAS